MEDSDAVRRKLYQLRDLNIGIHIDDFGTGFSSLSYLHRLPFSAIKIDQSFIRSIGKASGSMEIVRTIIALARNLNRSVIAEGIETPGQLKQLKALGCDYGQGFLFSEPRDKEHTQRMLLEDQLRKRNVAL